MRYILKIKNLKYKNMALGFIGLDLFTGNVRQYAILDENCNSIIDEVFPIDLNSMPECLFKLRMKDKRIERRYDKLETLPEEIKPFVGEYYHLIDEYNKRNGFSSDDLNFNMENLEINYSTCVCDDFINKGDYFCPKNSIKLTINKQKLDKERIKDILLHEMGHMSVTRSDFDIDSRILNCYIGLSPFSYLLEPIVGVGEDIIYVVKKRITNSEFMSIEEALNELECSFKKPDYHFVYPKYGEILNRLSEGTLIKARHEHDALEYFRVMKSIIEDTNLAQTLLEAMNESILPLREENIKKSFTLLKKYEQHKFQKSR